MQQTQQVYRLVAAAAAAAAARAVAIEGVVTRAADLLVNAAVPRKRKKEEVELRPAGAVDASK